LGEVKKWAPFIAMLLLWLYVGSVAAQDDTPPAEKDTPPPSSSLEEDDEELTDEKGMAPLAPFKAPKFKAMERFKREEEEERHKERERRASRPRSVPGAPTGEITALTLADLMARGESHINQLVLLKVYYMGKGSLKGKRFKIPRGKYNNIRVRDRDLEILNLIFVPKKDASILSRLKRNFRVTMVAKVIDVHNLTDMPILVVTALKKGWEFSKEDFLPEKEESPDADDTPGSDTPDADTPDADTPDADTPTEDTPGSETSAEDSPPSDDDAPSDDEPPDSDDDSPPSDD
jgi:hypothetical protein